MLPGTTTRWTNSKFWRDCSSFQVVLPGESGTRCNGTWLAVWQTNASSVAGTLVKEDGLYLGLEKLVIQRRGRGRSRLALLACPWPITTRPPGTYTPRRAHKTTLSSFGAQEPPTKQSGWENCEVILARGKRPSIRKNELRRGDLICYGSAEITHLRICRYLWRTLPQVVKYCQELNAPRSHEGAMWRWPGGLPLNSLPLWFTDEVAKRDAYEDWVEQPTRNCTDDRLLCDGNFS